MRKNSDTDQIFSEDPAAIGLNHKKVDLFSELKELVDPNLIEAVMPDKAPQHWSVDAVRIHAEYQMVTRELSRLNSQRTSQQLNRFLGSDSRGERTSKAMRRWWSDRY